MDMSNTLLAIISCPKDNELVARHWKYFLLSGWDIAGCGTVDGKCEWPEPVMRLDTGEVGLKNVGFGTAIHGLLRQELNIISAFLKTNYEFLAVAESDNVFVRKPPELPHGLYLAPTVPNYSPHLFSTPIYYTTPRIMDKEIARHVFHHGNYMMSQGDTQHWMSDRFFPHICHKHRIPFQHFPGFTAMPHYWWAKTHRDGFVRDARAAITMGACVIHGIKDEETLKAVTDGFDILPKSMSFATFQQDPSSYEIHPTCQIVNLGSLYEKAFGIGKKDGRYVEVGAFDGIIYSNVHGLAKAGWKGLAIEPMPENLVKLRETYAGIDNVTIEPVACSYPGNTELVMFSEREGSRLVEETNPRDLPVMTIPCATLDSILEKHNWELNFELLVIDTEGHEESVMKGFTTEKWKPKMIIMETAGRRPLLHNLIKGHYDIMFEDGLNTIFLRR